MELNEFMKFQQKARRYIAESNTKDLEKMIERTYILLVEAKSELRKREARENAIL